MIADMGTHAQLHILVFLLEKLKKKHKEFCEFTRPHIFMLSSQQVERKRDMGIKILFFNFVKLLDLLKKQMIKFYHSLYYYSCVT